MKRYVAGFDGGGTKTAMEARDMDGKVLLRYEAEGLNYNSNSEEALKDTLEELGDKLSAIEGGISSCDTLCVSTAGISNPRARGFFEKTLRELGFQCQLVFVGDHVGALYGSLGKGEGIILVSGTGSICYGKNRDGKESRTGGWGHLIDDEGSGYAIGRDILSAAVRSFDKRTESSILLPMVLKAIGGASIQDIIQYTYKAASKKDIAALAPLLTEALHHKDKEAAAIAGKAAEELVKLVLPVARQLELEGGEIAFTGGVLLHCGEIRREVEYRLSGELPELKIVKARYDSVAGAVFIALEESRRRRINHG